MFIITNGRKKLKIFKHSKTLKGIDIWIEKDCTRDIKQEQKLLVEHLKEARKKGCNAKIRYNKLIVNNKS